MARRIKDPGPVGSLAATHGEDQPGLPRGRGSLDKKAVLRAQRQRLRRAVVAAVAELGYGQVTIAEIIGRARVSYQAFYAQFDSKEACFISAAEDGIRQMLKRLGGAVTNSGASGSSSYLQSMIRAYLLCCRDEPEFTRFLAVEVLAAGPEMQKRRNTIMMTLARLFAATHKASGPAGAAPLSDLAYLGVVGAMQELVRHYAVEDKLDVIEELEAPFMELLGTLLVR